MACDSYYERLTIHSLHQFRLYQNLILVFVVNSHSMNFFLLLSDKFSDFLGGLVPVHLRHIAVHKYDTVEPPMLHPQLLGQLDRLLARDDAVNPLVIGGHVNEILWHFNLVDLLGI